LHASPTQLSNWSSATVVLANAAVFRSVVIQLQEIAAPAFGVGGGIFFRPGPSGGMSE